MRLHADYVSGEYDFAQPCERRPGGTQVCAGIGGQDVCLLVRDKGNHNYEMTDISFDRQPGCPGETQVDYDHRPSLF
jgi:hypothetical protein